MNLDLYHAQIGEGNLIDLLGLRAVRRRGPGRRRPRPLEPFTGEIHYPAVATALHDIGYTGVVGLEAWACGDPDTALERFRTAFTG